MLTTIIASEYTTVFLHSFRMACSFWDSIFLWLVHWWAKPMSVHIDNHLRCLAPVLSIGQNLQCLLSWLLTVMLLQGQAAVRKPSVALTAAHAVSNACCLVEELSQWLSLSNQISFSSLQLCIQTVFVSPNCVHTCLVLFVYRLVIPWATSMSGKKRKFSDCAFG